jgi:hypothetical protein
MADEGFGEVMANAVAAIADMAGALYPESGSTMDRKMDQGCAELAAALFGGSDAYVAYGQGQQAVEMEAPQVEQAVQAVEAPQMERGGMEI